MKLSRRSLLKFFGAASVCAIPGVITAKEVQEAAAKLDAHDAATTTRDTVPRSKAAREFMDFMDICAYAENRACGAQEYDEAMEARVIEYMQIMGLDAEPERAEMAQAPLVHWEEQLG